MLPTKNMGWSHQKIRAGPNKMAGSATALHETRVTAIRRRSPDRGGVLCTSYIHVTAARRSYADTLHLPDTSQPEKHNSLAHRLGARRANQIRCRAGRLHVAVRAIRVRVVEVKLSLVFPLTSCPRYQWPSTGHRGSICKRPLQRHGPVREHALGHGEGHCWVLQSVS